MGFFDKLKESASKAADKAKDSVEVVRLNSQVAAKRKEIEKMYLQIGEAVFEAYTSNAESAAEELIKANSATIITLKQEIEQLEIKIRTLKDEKDCVCGQVLPLDAKFCSSCGHRFEEPSEVVVQANETVAIEAAHEAAATTESISVKSCSNCQATLQADDRFCENCGTAVEGQ